MAAAPSSSRRTLFAVLAAQPWWVSVAIGAIVFAGIATFNALVAAAAAVPFFGVAGYAAWLRLRSGPDVDIPAMLKALRAASVEEIRAMLAETYTAQGYKVDDAAGGDLALERNKYVTLVRYRRWRAQSTGVAAIEELAGAMRARGADHGVHISAGSFADNVRLAAEKAAITPVDGVAFVALVKRTRGARVALERSAAAEAKKA